MNDITFLLSPEYQLPNGLFRCTKFSKLFKYQGADSKWSDKPLVIKENEKRACLQNSHANLLYHEIRGIVT